MESTLCTHLWEETSNYLVLHARTAGDYCGDDDNCYIWLYYIDAYGCWTAARCPLLNRSQFDRANCMSQWPCLCWLWFLMRPSHISMQYEVTNAIFSFDAHLTLKLTCLIHKCCTITDSSRLQTPCWLQSAHFSLKLHLNSMENAFGRQPH